MHVLSSLLRPARDGSAQSMGVSVGMAILLLLVLVMRHRAIVTWLARVCLDNFVVDLEDCLCTRGMPIRLADFWLVCFMVICLLLYG
jgi:hypothetical protein